MKITFALFRTSIFLFFLFPTIFHAQAPAIEWAVCLGGNGMEGASSEYNTANTNYGLQVLQTADGGYVAAGNTNQNSGYVQGVNSQSMDMWIVKTDSQGNFQWQSALGSQGADTAASIDQTADGGYIVAGYTSVSGGDVTGHHGGGDMWVVRLDAVGNMIWQKCLGGPGTEKAYSIKQTTDGGFIVTGFAGMDGGDVTGHHAPLNSADMWVVKINAAGEVQWQKSLGGSGDDVGYSVWQTADGGYIVGGATISKDGDVTGNHTYYNTGTATHVASWDYWVVKLSATGDLLWEKCLGGTGEDIAYSLQQTLDGGYIVAGKSTSNNGDVTGNHGFRDFWVVKLDDAGAIQWQKNLGGSSNDSAHFIDQTTDGGYIIAGSSNSVDGDVTGHHGTSSDYWVARLDGDGNLQWQKSLGGTKPDLAYSVQQTQDGGFVLAGTTISQDGDVTGLHYNVSATDFWMVKLAPDALSTPAFTQESVTFSPNPVKDMLQVSSVAKRLTVTDATGKMLAVQLNVSAIDLSGLTSGVYFVTFELENGAVGTRKIIKN